MGPRTLVELTPHTMFGVAAAPTVVPLADTVLMPRSSKNPRFVAVKMGEKRRVAHVADTKVGRWAEGGRRRRRRMWMMRLLVHT